MAMFRAVFLLAVLLLCGGAGPMMTTDKTAAIRRVAVMSAVGDKFTVRKIGITVFGNDEKEFPIDAWGIDQFVVNKMRSVLARRFEVRPVAYCDLAALTPAESSATIRGRVDAARRRQLDRFRGRPVFRNAQMATRDLRRHCVVESAAERLLAHAMDKLALSARAYTRILKVARTIADLDAAEPIRAAHVAEAIQYRSLDRDVH